MIKEYQCKDYIEWMSMLCKNPDLNFPCIQFEEAIEAGLGNCIYEREEWEKKNKELTEKIDEYYKESTK